jgi:fructose-bisphosphate aldolase, class II
MSLINVLPWIERAYREGWAVGAFNAVNMEQAQAIAWAAEAENAPAIIQVSHRALLYVGGGDAVYGLKMMAAVGKAAADSVRAPLALHMDHGSESEVRLALELGFTSVMFDADGLALEENLAITRRLAELAHAAGACMEAEVGDVPRITAEGAIHSEEGLTHPEDAQLFARSAGVDTLAIAIGSVHAVKRKEVDLDLERLRAIRAAVVQPLVLHGSSGVTDESLRAGIALGLAKINTATQLSQGFTAAARAVLQANPAESDPRQYLGPGRAAMVEAVRERIKLVGASGKAASG